MIPSSQASTLLYRSHRIAVFTVVLIVTFLTIVVVVLFFFFPLFLFWLLSNENADSRRAIKGAESVQLRCTEAGNTPTVTP
jgi:hypothetical protein